MDTPKPTRTSTTVARVVNEFILEVIGAGGAIWACFAIFRAIIDEFVYDEAHPADSIPFTSHWAYTATAMTMAALATVNAAIVKYGSTTTEWSKCVCISDVESSAGMVMNMLEDRKVDLGVGTV